MMSDHSKPMMKASASGVRNPSKLNLSGACSSTSSHPLASASMALDRRAIGTPPPQSLRKPFHRPPNSPLVAGEPSDSGTALTDSSKCQIFILDRDEDVTEDEAACDDDTDEQDGDGGLIPPTRLVARPVDGVVFEVTRSEMTEVSAMTPFTSTAGLAARRRNKTERP